METWCKNWKLKVKKQKNIVHFRKIENNKQHLNLNLKIICLIL